MILTLRLSGHINYNGSRRRRQCYKSSWHVIWCDSQHVFVSSLPLSFRENFLSRTLFSFFFTLLHQNVIFLWITTAQLALYVCCTCFPWNAILNPVLSTHPHLSSPFDDFIWLLREKCGFWWLDCVKPYCVKKWYSWMNLCFRGILCVLCCRNYQGFIFLSTVFYLWCFPSLISPDSGPFGCSRLSHEVSPWLSGRPRK